MFAWARHLWKSAAAICAEAACLKALASQLTPVVGETLRAGTILYRLPLPLPHCKVLLCTAQMPLTGGQSAVPTDVDPQRG